MLTIPSLDLFGNLLRDTDPALSGARNPHVLYVNEGCCAPGALTSHNELRFPKRSIVNNDVASRLFAVVRLE